MKGKELLNSDELSLFEWYIGERTKTIDLMLAEEHAYIEEQINSGLDPSDVNNSGIFAIEYYIKRTRHADVIYLISLLELYLSRASKKLEEVLGSHNVTFRANELAGNKWTRSKIFLERYGKFGFPDVAWDTLKTLIDVRNILVHENGGAAAILEQPGLQAIQGELVVEDTYITHCLSAFRSPVQCVNNQINQSIDRSLQPQLLKV